jgi:hypothetical protein
MGEINRLGDLSPPWNLTPKKKPRRSGVLSLTAAKVGIGHIPPSCGMSCGHFDFVTGFGVEPGPFIPSLVMGGLLKGFH